MEKPAGSEPSATTECYAFVQFPNEPNALISFGSVEIKVSATFMHALMSVLECGRNRSTETYARDMDEFQQAMELVEHELLQSAEKQTEEQQSLLLERYQTHGRGFWSSWMSEPRPW
jgi:hypothetical protein